jgi:nitrogen fixation NifU-like protein
VSEVAGGGRPRDALEVLYREVVLDHYRTPRNRTPLEEPDAVATVDNPVCGDQVRVEVKLEGDRVSAVSARARGCSIAVAAGSVMTELVRGSSRSEVERMRATLEGLVGGEPAGEGVDRRLRAFAGVARFPSRRRCALLAWEALAEALDSRRAPRGTG